MKITETHHAVRRFFVGFALGMVLAALMAIMAVL